jgi:hypothetical protein
MHTHLDAFDILLRHLLSFDGISKFFIKNQVSDGDVIYRDVHFNSLGS